MHSFAVLFCLFTLKARCSLSRSSGRLSLFFVKLDSNAVGIKKREDISFPKLTKSPLKPPKLHPLLLSPAPSITVCSAGRFPAPGCHGDLTPVPRPSGCCYQRCSVGRCTVSRPAWIPVRLPQLSFVTTSYGFYPLKKIFSRFYTLPLFHKTLSVPWDNVQYYRPSPRLSYVANSYGFYPLTQ